VKAAAVGDVMLVQSIPALQHKHERAIPRPINCFELSENHRAKYFFSQSPITLSISSPSGFSTHTKYSNMSGRLVKVVGAGAVAGAGYYLYQAGGKPKVAEKQFERMSDSQSKLCSSRGANNHDR
jgi:hypothetical protein